MRPRAAKFAFEVAINGYHAFELPEVYVKPKTSSTYSIKSGHDCLYEMYTINVVNFWSKQLYQESVTILARREKCIYQN